MALHTAEFMPSTAGVYANGVNARVRSRFVGVRGNECARCGPLYVNGANKMVQSTSNRTMRYFLRCAVAAMVVSLPGVSSAFTCPLMPAAEARNEACSPCPEEKQQESCPRSACLLVCPYTLERTAVLNGEGLTVGFVLDAQFFSAVLRPRLSDARVQMAGAQEPFATPTLYLLNRVLLI
jgi:hypothetical protein